MRPWCSTACHGCGGQGWDAAPAAVLRQLHSAAPCCSLTRSAGPGLTCWVQPALLCPMGPARPSREGTWCRWLWRAVHPGVEVLLGLWHRCDPRMYCVFAQLLFYLLCSEAVPSPCSHWGTVRCYLFFPAITEDELNCFYQSKRNVKETFKSKALFLMAFG